MTAPERIWAIPVGGADDPNFSNAWIVMGSEPGAIEFVRADLVADQIRAAVQASRRVLEIMMEIEEDHGLECIPCTDDVERLRDVIAAAIRAR